MKNKYTLLLNICAVFYAVLCVYSIVTGLMYALGDRELSTIELSDALVEKLSDSDSLNSFAKIMGWVTFGVGIIQGLSSFALFKKGRKLYYYLPLGFTIFSLCSAAYKLIGKFSVFASVKAVCYTAIIAVLLLPQVKKQFFEPGR